MLVDRQVKRAAFAVRGRQFYAVGKTYQTSGPVEERFTGKLCLNGFGRCSCSRRSLNRRGNRFGFAITLFAITFFVITLFSGEHLKLPRAVTVDRNPFAARLERLRVGAINVLYGRVVGHVDGFGDTVGDPFAARVEGALHRTLHQHVGVRGDVVRADQHTLYRFRDKGDTLHAAVVVLHRLDHFIPVPHALFGAIRVRRVLLQHFTKQRGHQRRVRIADLAVDKGGEDRFDT